MKDVIVLLGHGLVPKIFWVRKTGQGVRLERAGKTFQHDWGLSALLLLADGLKNLNSLDPDGCVVQ
jgi:hypothetical protein